MGRLFDAYIAVDWSARSKPSPRKPSKDAIWIGEAVATELADSDVADLKGYDETYIRTRQACYEYVRERLLYHVQSGRRVLIGFDFAYGYPSGLATALGLEGKSRPWKQIWNELASLIVDGPDNDNNRFDVAAELNLRCDGPVLGPFWGCPVTYDSPALTMKSPQISYPFPIGDELSLNRYRIADRRVKGVQSAWKLFGSGSVGGQSLVGIPVVHRLREDSELSAVSCVWPFETGFGPSPVLERGPCILHVEIWPGLVSDSLDAELGIRDRAQVRAMVRWLRALDDRGTLSSLFETPQSMSPAEIEVCVREEGWILGGGVL